MLIDFILKNRQKYINFLIIKKHYTSFNIFKLSVTKSTDVGFKIKFRSISRSSTFFLVKEGRTTGEQGNQDANEAHYPILLVMNDYSKT